MSTILNTNGDSLKIPAYLGSSDDRFVVVTADWNSRITHSLRDAAIETLRSAGISESSIVKVAVPGTVELVNAAALYSNRGAAAVIVIGVVIRGDTPHFDYVCHIAAEGTALLNAKGETPVIFGVLTVNNLEQALQRAGGELGNKGAEAAVAAIEMANLHLSRKM